MANSSCPWSWDDDPSDNANIDADMTWPEGINARLVNDRMRSFMSIVHKLLGDMWVGATVGGSANAITLTTSMTIDTLEEGMVFLCVPTANNTGATTVNVSGTGAKALKTRLGNALVGGEIFEDAPLLIRYDGTDYNIMIGGSDLQTPLFIKGFTLAGGTTAYTLTSDYTIPEETGTTIVVLPNDESTGNVTLAINGGTARQVRNIADQQLKPGQFRALRPTYLRWVGGGTNRWLVVNQTQDDDYSWSGFSTGGSATAYTITPGAANRLETLYDGLLIVVKWHATNTGHTPTLALDGTAATTILLADGVAPGIGDLLINRVDWLRYDGTNWIVLTKRSRATVGFYGTSTDLTVDSEGSDSANPSDDRSANIDITQVKSASSLDVIIRGHCRVRKTFDGNSGDSVTLEARIKPVFFDVTWQDAAPEESFSLGPGYDVTNSPDSWFDTEAQFLGCNFCFIFTLANADRNGGDWRFAINADVDEPGANGVAIDASITNIRYLAFER